MLNLITRLAVTDNTDIAYLVNIMEGVDGSSVMGIGMESNEIRIEDNQTMDISHDYSLDVRVIDTTTESNLINTFCLDQKKCLIAGLTPTGFVIFNKPTLIVRNRQYETIVAMVLKATQRTLQNYGTGEMPVYVGGNLLGIFQVTKATNGTRMDGLQPQVANTFTGSYSSGIWNQTLTGTGKTNFGTIFFPFDGVPLSFTIERVTGNTGGTLGMDFLNAAGSEIGTTSTTSIATGTGLTTLTATTPANTRSVRAYITPTSRVDFKEPRIRLLGATQFVL